MHPTLRNFVSQSLSSAQYVEFKSKCANCGSTAGAAKKCSTCHVARYCSKECQLSHWKAHKKVCVTQEAEGLTISSHAASENDLYRGSLFTGQSYSLWTGGETKKVKKNQIFDVKIQVPLQADSRPPLQLGQLATLMLYNETRDFAVELSRANCRRVEDMFQLIARFPGCAGKRSVF